MSLPRSLFFFAFAFCAFVGLACVVMWTDLVGQSSPFVEVVNATAGAPNARILCLVGQVVAALLYTACLKVLRHWDRVFMVVVILLYILFAGAFFFQDGAMGHRTALALGCLFLSGMGYTAIAIYFLSQIARFPSTLYILGIIVSALAGETLAFSLADALSWDIHVVAGLLIVPLLAVVCAIALSVLARHVSLAGDIAELPKLHDEARQRMFVLLAIIAILRASVRALGTMGFWGQGSVRLSFFDSLVSVVLLCIFAWLALLLYKNEDPFNRFLPAFFVVLGGFFLIDPTFSINQAFLGRLTFLGPFVEMFTYAMYWYVIVVAIRQLDLYPYRIAGIAFLLFSGFSIPLVLVLSQSDALAAPLVMLVQYGFIVVMGVVSLTTHHPASENQVTSKESRLEQLAEHYQLSPRECEVFLLLAQGRSRSYIEKELFIAEGTVKTHTTRIYQKFGVSSKQELISFVHGEDSSE